MENVCLKWQNITDLMHCEIEKRGKIDAFWVVCVTNQVTYPITTCVGFARV